MQDLPTEMQCCILRHVKRGTLLMCLLVNRAFHELTARYITMNKRKRKCVSHALVSFIAEGDGLMIFNLFALFPMRSVHDAAKRRVSKGLAKHGDLGMLRVLNECNFPFSLDISSED